MTTGGIHRIEEIRKEKNSIDNNDDLLKEPINYLNSKLGSKYRIDNKTTQKHIKARLSEGFTLEDFKTVIDKKYEEWYGTDMQQYLRPETLFGTKFESYLNSPKIKNKNLKHKNYEQREYNNLDDFYDNM